jgi:predicted ATPase/class 3 adenylate cyclase
MSCAGCGFEAAEDFAFCPKCGTKLTPTCPSCGAPTAPDFVFCSRCGGNLGAADVAAKTVPLPANPVPDAEYADRRPVTVLFADLTAFTALSERLDPEDVRALQTELYEELREALTRFGGFMEKFVGDAAMAMFGAPVAHEEDPERALRAALEMHARVAALSTRWERRLGGPLTLHVGINTGRVVAGNIGSAEGAYAVTGDTVNTAARLQSAAQPGETLVSRATYLLTHHAFVFEPRGTVTLKGKAEPLPTYRLIGVEEHARSARGLEAHGLQAPMVGRDDEMKQMLAAFDLALRGRSQVVSLIGEAGAGKSRLVEEFLERIQAREDTQTVTVRSAVCSSLGEQPYGVIAMFIRQGYGLVPADSVEVARRKIEEGLRELGVDAEEAAGVAPMVGYVLGLQSAEGAPDIEPDRLSRQILMLVRIVLERRLDQGPLLLIVEDLHWADAASIQGMRLLVDWFADRPLMLLFTYRPSFDNRVLGVVRATHTALRLAPLSDADIDAMLNGLFDTAASRCISSDLHQLIVRRAGGNPFYLEEILRGLIADGILVGGADGWTCGGQVSQVDVPPTIEALLLSRVDRLPPHLRRCLQEAAVVGPVFDAPLLRLVAGEPLDETIFERLSQAELIEEVHDASTRGLAPRERPYRFAHALVHEVVYRNLLLDRRTELHGRAGQALEQLRGTRPERLEDLALLGHHFGLSDDPRRGARYLVAAADWARGIYANDDAIRHYEHALHILQDCDVCTADTVEIHERLGDLLVPMGRGPEALEHYETCRRVAEETGDDVRQARVCRKIGGVHWDAGERQQGLACFETGLGLLEGRVEHIELAYLYQEMGRLAFRSGDNEGAVEWAQRALAQAEGATARASADDSEARREAADAVAHALNTLGSALARLDRAEEAVQHIERSVAVARSEGSLQVACRSYANLGVLYATLNPGRAVETCLTGLETARKIGDLGFQSRLYANLAVAYCALTDRCDVDGLRAAQAAIDLDRRLGQRDHLAVPLIVLGQIHQCHGDLGTALRYYHEALIVAEESGEPQLLFPCYDGIATVHLDRGDRAEAERYLVKAQHVCERAGVDRDSLVVLPFLS